MTSAREHQLVGHVNPKCARCGRTLMQILTVRAPCTPDPLKVIPPPVRKVQATR